MQEAMTCIWRKQKDHSFKWPLLAMCYKKDIFGIIEYEFELLHK